MKWPVLKVHLVLVLITCVLSAVCVAQEASPQQLPDGSLVDQKLRRNANWTQEGWKGNNKPFHALKLDLESQLKKAAYSPNLAETAKKEFLKHRKDPLKLFSWAYLAYRTGFPGPRSPESNAIVVRDWFYVVPSPHTADYSRLRFLIEVREFRAVFFPTDKLLPLGRRLLALDPDDSVVKEKLALVLVCGSTTAQIDEGIGFAKDLLVQPNAANSIRHMIGFGYCCRYYRTKDKSDARKAVEHWRDYIAHAATAQAKNSTQKMIDQITKDAKL